MNFNYADWAEGTYQSNNDPTEFNGKNRKCNLCDKDAENMDEYCENHQRCIVCGDNDDCDCKDELSQISSCCEAKMDTDRKMCFKCSDHCSSSWEEAVESCSRR
tara:strand:+ start:447 stop:758 length:312 start_codon:yes stop_codon:yes gene_type:complete